MANQDIHLLGIVIIYSSWLWLKCSEQPNPHFFAITKLHNVMPTFGFYRNSTVNYIVCERHLDMRRITFVYCDSYDSGMDLGLLSGRVAPFQSKILRIFLKKIYKKTRTLEGVRTPFTPPLDPLMMICFTVLAQTSIRKHLL